jgi:hypothetical protein
MKLSLRRSIGHRELIRSWFDKAQLEQITNGDKPQLQEPMQSSPRINIVDMATVIKTIREFNADNEEDATKWLHGSQVMTSIAQFDEEQTLVSLMMKLRGSTLTWLTQTKQNSNVMNLLDFSKGLERRFSTQNSTEKILRRFLNVGVVSSESAYNEMLKDATILYERGSIGNEALYKLTINKTPDVLKPILLQIAYTVSDWQGFVARAGEISWIAFSSNAQNIESGKKLSKILRIYHSLR